jgi:hypothetical protein
MFVMNDGALMAVKKLYIRLCAARDTALKRHKSTLRVLKLRDLNIHDPQATFDVEALRTLCPCLKELELGIKIYGET